MKKICTDISQSKKLIELGININTADMWYINGEGKSHIGNWSENQHDWDDIPAWSLSALLELIPPYLGEFNEGIDFGLSKSMNKKWYSAHYIQLNDDGIATFNKTVTGDTAIDAAFEMVCWLLESHYI